MTLSPSLGAAPDLPLILLAAGSMVIIVAAVITRWTLRRRTAGPRRTPSSRAVKVAALAAVVCTGYSADTSWRFAADHLDMAGTGERIVMFAAAELALFATALMARENLASQGAPGLPGALVWVITGVQIIPAYAASGLVGGTVRAFVGPVMAAMLWHLAMGIELRLRAPGAASRGLVATLSREVRERLLSRLGIAARDRDAAQITRDRATARAVALATRLAERSPKQRSSWRGQRLNRKLSKAIGRACVGTNPEQRTVLLDQLAARRHAMTLATMPLPSPWSLPAEGGPGPGSDGPPRPQGPVPAVPASEAQAPVPAVGTGPARHPDQPGTGPDDRPARTVPVRRRPSTNSSPARRPGSRRADSRAKATPLSVDELVHQVRPHVPAVLARDGNETLTRVQLREILRREGLTGGRNDRLSRVLAELRRVPSTEMTRSTN